MHERDAILKLGRFTRRFSLFKHLRKQRSLGKVFLKYSYEVTEALQACLVLTGGSEKIKMLLWPKDVKFFTKLSKSPIITAG